MATGLLAYERKREWGKWPFAARKILISYYLCGRRMYVRVRSPCIVRFMRRNGGEHDDVGESRGPTRRGKCDVTDRLAFGVYVCVCAPIARFNADPIPRCPKYNVMRSRCTTRMYIRAIRYRKSGACGGGDRENRRRWHTSLNDR